MRVIVDDYTRGGRGAYEESNDGSAVVAEWLGPTYPIWEQTDAFIEASCKDTPEALAQLMQSLTWLRDEIIRRKGDPRVSANGQPRAAELATVE